MQDNLKTTRAARPMPKPPATPKLPAKRRPPATAPKSRQYDLFTEFFGDRRELSNTVELWDAIPKFAVSARRQVGLRDDKGRLPVHEYGFEYAGRACRLELHPASIKVGDRFQDFYPSADEELVEEVLRKIFADQTYGIHIVESLESWVRFSLHMIRTELHARGKTRSLDEIKRSIDILATTIVRVYVESAGDDAIYTEPILGTLIKGRRATSTGDDPTLWAARLPSLLSKSVNDLTYRQFNYGTLMTLSGQLARWLHKRLSHNYTNASAMQPYTVRYSTLRRDSGLIEANTITKNVAAVEQALDELVDRRVLFRWVKEERRSVRNKLDDVMYTLHASMDFTAEVKAANGRQKDGRSGRLSERLLFQK